MEEHQFEKINILISQLIELSEKDFISAKLLHQNQLYAQSVFYLQQSVEKLTKAIGLLTYSIQPSELKHKIGHKTYKIYKVGLQKIIPYFQNFPDFPSSDGRPDKAWAENMLRDINEEVTNLNNWQQETSDIYSESDMEAILLKCEGLFSYTECFDYTGIPDYDYSNHSDSELPTNDEIISVLTSFLNLLPRGFYVLLMNFLMLKLTSKQFDLCRYPDFDKNHHPLQYYTSHHFLVKYFERLVPYHDRSIHYSKELKEVFARN